MSIWLKFERIVKRVELRAGSCDAEESCAPKTSLKIHPRTGRGDVRAPLTSLGLFRRPGRLGLKLANDCAFSLIEIVGLLALIAIVVSLLVPQVFKARSPAHAAAQAVNQAHIEEVVADVAGIKTAIAAHYSQFGSLASSNGVPLRVSGSYEHYDRVLLAEGFLDRPFAVAMGAKALLRLVDVSGFSSATIVDGASGAYDLDGDGKNDVVGAAYVVEIVIPGVTEDEARAVNERVDGPAVGANSSGSDLLGRVTWPQPTPGSPREVHIYITHH